MKVRSEIVGVPSPKARDILIIYRNVYNGVEESWTHNVNS